MLPCLTLAAVAGAVVTAAVVAAAAAAAAVDDLLRAFSSLAQGLESEGIGNQFLKWIGIYQSDQLYTRLFANIYMSTLSPNVYKVLKSKMSDYDFFGILGF